MKKLSVIILVVISISIKVQSQDNVPFEVFFENKTMRVDYFHSGMADEEHFAVDRILNDGDWSGSKTILLDNLNRGLYFFEVLDSESDELLYSRGFSSIFGEWQTIPEAEKQWGTFHESIRFPWPLKSVNVIMKKRDAKNEFTQIWELKIDPASRIVNPAELIQIYKTFDYMVNGPAEEKVDIVILGDGYTKEEMEKFYSDVERLAGELFEVEPFKSRRTDFNVRAVQTSSTVSGVNRHQGCCGYRSL
jgi:hypothetical protein